MHNVYTSRYYEGLPKSVLAVMANKQRAPKNRLKIRHELGEDVPQVYVTEFAIDGSIICENQVNRVDVISEGQTIML